MGNQRGRAWRRSQRQKYIRRREHLLYDAPDPTTVLVWQLWINGEPTDVLHKQSKLDPVDEQPPDHVVGYAPCYSTLGWGHRYEDTEVESRLDMPDGRVLTFTTLRRVLVFKPPLGSVWRCIRRYVVEHRGLAPGQLAKNSNPKDVLYNGKPKGKGKRWKYLYLRSVKARRARKLGRDYDLSEWDLDL